MKKLTEEEVISLIEHLNVLIDSVDFSTDYPDFSEDSANDKYGHADDAFIRGEEIGEDLFGQALADILNGFEILTDKNVKRMEEAEKDREEEEDENLQIGAVAKHLSEHPEILDELQRRIQEEKPEDWIE